MDTVYYKCLISVITVRRTFGVRWCMNPDKCFCFLPLYPKEQPTNFHQELKCCDFVFSFIFLKLCLGLL